MFELKLLSAESIPGALAKAERYRLLNQPWEAQSIYLDVLQIDQENQEALVGLLLALTDQFADEIPGSVNQTREVLARIRDEYERAYYAGIICERRAKVLLRQSKRGSGRAVHDLLQEALRCFERASELRPPGNDDALLRWNACARLAMRYPGVLASADDRYEPYADA